MRSHRIARGRWRLVAAALALTLIAAACGDDGDGGGETSDGPAVEVPAEPVAGGSIVYGLDDDGTGFDTTDTMAPGAVRIATAVVEPLATTDADGMWQPYLAESITANEDATVWTIALRPDITFHDGAALDADALKANLDAFKAGPSVGFVFAPVAETTVIDDLTVEVTMSSPWSAFPTQLTTQPGWMVSPDTLGENETMTGTGPFTLESWVPGDSAQVAAFDGYWRADEGLPYLDSIEYKVIPEQAARRQALEAGDVDAYVSPGDAALVDFAETDTVDEYVPTTNSNEFVVILNTAEAPFDDLRVREAMAHAVDRPLLIENFRSNLTEPANTFIDPASPWYTETDYPEFDLDAAATLVEEYEAENGDIEFTLDVQNVTSTSEVAQVMVSFWQDAGMDVTLEEVAPGTDIDNVINDDFDAVTWFQFSGADPDTAWIFMHSAAGALNWSNLQDDELDAAFDEGRESSDPDERAEAYAAVQERLASQLPFIWIDHLAGVEAVVSTPNVQGFQESTFPGGAPTSGFFRGSFHPFAQVWTFS